MAQRTSSRTNKGQDTRLKYEDEQAQQQPKKPKEHILASPILASHTGTADTGIAYWHRRYWHPVGIWTRKETPSEALL